MAANFIISDSPYIHSGKSTKKIMLLVIIALLPAIAASVYFFRTSAIYLISTCVISCVVFEYLIRKIRHKEILISDLSAVVTGILIALILPPKFPLGAAVIGCLAAVFLGKEVFGGLGSNIFNPALIGRAFLMSTFPILTTTWYKPISLQAVTTATPLGLMKFQNVTTDIQALFWGNVSGSLGETSAAALLLGGIILLLSKTIDWRIPFSYIVTVILISLSFHLIDPANYAGPLFEVLAGGLIIGAFFMATDPVTSPVTGKGRFIFGVGCGILTMVIRYWGGLPEGVMYSILFMNALRPLIDKFTRPVCFGG
jgi:electron transport complex protein RnfD